MSIAKVGFRTGRLIWAMPELLTNSWLLLKESSLLLNARYHGRWVKYLLPQSTAQMESSTKSSMSGIDFEKKMMEEQVDRVGDALNGKVVFLTGATGMLGTALVAKMILDTKILRIFVLVRGGSVRFWSRMQQLLPSTLVEAIDTSNKIVVLSGDITYPDLGLEQKQIENVQNTVNIFIHAASSINLKRDLSRLMKEIVLPSMEAARLALGCANLERFVYVSTAFVNAFLHFKTNGSNLPDECVVEERIYPLRNDTTVDSASAELSTLLEFGVTPQFTCVPHPFAYAYAKHLTERLLEEAFAKAGLSQLIMLFRPSIFSPAEREPFTHFEVVGSAPATSMLAAILASPPGHARFSANLSDASKATFDEIPIDMVVNRLLAHVAYATSGCVHAVSTAASRTPFPQTFDFVTQLRPWWWCKPKIVWCGEKSGAVKTCPMSEMWSGILGCSFLFCDSKTLAIWGAMDEAARTKWPLYGSRELMDMSDWSRRAYAANILLHSFLQKRHGRLGGIMAKLVRSRKAQSPGASSGMLDLSG